MEEPTSKRSHTDVPTPGKRSRSMEAAKAEQRAQILAMTPRARVELALALGRRLEALRKAQVGG